MPPSGKTILSNQYIYAKPKKSKVHKIVLPRGWEECLLSLYHSSMLAGVEWQLFIYASAAILTDMVALYYSGEVCGNPCICGCCKIRDSQLEPEKLKCQN